MTRSFAGPAPPTPQPGSTSAAATRPAPRLARLRRRCWLWGASLAALGVQIGWLGGFVRAEGPVQFARDIKPILSNNCFYCHGPDAAQRKGGAGGLRLDTAEGATADLGGYAAIAPGDPDNSVLLARICSPDADELMPPPATGKKLTPREIDLLKRWIREGAAYAGHWSYVKPVRPPTPAGALGEWPRGAIDRFVLARLEQEGLAPTPEADRETLVRRLSLDLIGLPPTLEEVDAFSNDAGSGAYERLVDRLLADPAYGERWAGMWLDLARYADSAGYADDPPRTIWAYRDYVIRAFNSNKSFDRFTVEQIAGDLLPGAGQEQLVATAFHRNTPTNNEGGTNDEEFRNVAIVDRVNTTAAVWLGTTMACAQCHHHKFDPISQEEYFGLFAILNNTEDADRRDESPTLSFYEPGDQRERDSLLAEQGQLRQKLGAVTPELTQAAERWATGALAQVRWRTLSPAPPESAAYESAADGSLNVLAGPAPDGAAVGAASSQSGEPGKTAPANAAPAKKAPGKPVTHSVDVTFAPPSAPFRALRVEVLPMTDAAGELRIARLTAVVRPATPQAPRGRFVRIELPGEKRMLSLAEVEVFAGAENFAPTGVASQSSVDFDGAASRAIDRDTNGDFQAKSVTHTKQSKDPWWEVDLKSEQSVDRIVIWNRTDGRSQSRLDGVRLSVLDAARKTLWEQTLDTAPERDAALAPSLRRTIEFKEAAADFAAEIPTPGAALKIDNPAQQGWRIAGSSREPRALAFSTKTPVEIAPGDALSITLAVVREKAPSPAPTAKKPDAIGPDAATSDDARPPLGRFRFSISESKRALDAARIPVDLQAALGATADAATGGATGAANVDSAPGAAVSLSPEQRDRLTRVYLPVAGELAPTRQRLAQVDRRLDEIKPNTVPVIREVAAGKRRQTRIQRRGNFLDLGAEMAPGTPSICPPPALSAGQSVDRLALARWLVDESNPLTARVTANRFWEQLFGVGLVATSEEFGSQGELPSHPELLDWLARELVESGWNVKALLKQIVMSATYRQSSRVSPELAARDPDNRLLARGPRVRLSAEMVRDQALAASGLLSRKMHGAPVRPPQPSMGLKAAFGGATDWQTSSGEDRYRRALYTTWRRSNPYPSMTTFDAPNRDVCAVRRSRTNTPLQALVTLNDPVFVESAQALARRMLSASDATPDRLRHGFRLCLARWPSDSELARLTRLYDSSRARFEANSAEAEKLASDPIGPPPAGVNQSELAALVVVGNVMLNLDELLMKR